MANLDQIAHGLVTVLRHSPTPDPLPVDLWNEGPAEATYLIRAVIDECTAAGVPLSRVRADPSMLNATLSAYEGVTVEPDSSLSQRVEFDR